MTFANLKYISCVFCELPSFWAQIAIFSPRKNICYLICSELLLIIILFVLFLTLRIFAFYVLICYINLFVGFIYFLVLRTLVLFFVIIFAKTKIKSTGFFILFLKFMADFKILVLDIKDAHFQKHLSFVFYMYMVP